MDSCSTQSTVRSSAIWFRFMTTLLRSSGSLRRPLLPLETPNYAQGGLELIAKLRTIEVNIEHNLGFITEVLNRLEVTLMPPHVGKLDKQTQRAIAVELAEDPDEDNAVVRFVKRGFLWKDRLFRAEEVVIKKWKEGFLVALSVGDENPG